MHIEDVLGLEGPVELQTCAECLFVGALRTLSKKRGLQLSHPSVREELKSTEHYYWMENQYGGDYALRQPQYYMQDCDCLDQVQYLETDTTVELVYDTSRPDTWVMNKTLGSSFVFFIAKIMLEEYVGERQKKEIKLIFVSGKPLAYTEIYSLLGHGLKSIKGKVTIIPYLQNMYIRPEWQAYIETNSLLGLIGVQKQRAEKERIIRKQFKKGDYVLFYTLKDKAEVTMYRPLLSCYAACITNISREGVELVYYPCLQTEVMQARELAELIELEPEAERSLFVADYCTYKHRTKQISYEELGVLNAFCGETHLMLRLQNMEEQIDLLIYNEQQCKTEQVKVSTIEAVYVVLSEREESFDAEAFRKEYSCRTTEEILKGVKDR